MANDGSAGTGDDAEQGKSPASSIDFWGPTLDLHSHFCELQTTHNNTQGSWHCEDILVEEELDCGIDTKYGDLPPGGFLFGLPLILPPCYRHFFPFPIFISAFSMK